MCSINPTDQNGKLEEVLRLLTLPDYNIASTTVLDILSSHIAKNISSGYPANSEGIEKSSLQKWVLQALGTWTAEQKPCQAVVMFTLKLVGLMGSNEFDFLYWYREDVLAKLRAVFGLGERDVQASVKVAYIGMLMDFLNHNSGRQWIVESGSWRDVIKFCHTNHTLYVTRESQTFVWKLLLLEAGDTKFCKEVISVAAKPLITNTCSSQPYPTLEDNYFDRNEILLTVIDLLNTVLENTLFVSMDNTIPRLLESVTNLESRIKGLFEACTSSKLLEHIMKLMFLLLLLTLKVDINEANGVIDPEVINNFCVNFRYIDSTLLAKKYILELVKGRKLFMIYWKKMNSLCKVELTDQYKLEIQCLVIMLMPLGCCMPVRQLEEEMLNMFIQKLINLTCTYTQRLYYMMRDTLRKEEMPIEKICEICIQTVMAILDIIDRDGAVIAFQTLSHLLRDFVSLSNSKSDKPVGPVEMDKRRNSQIQKTRDFDPIVQFPNLLSVLLEGLSTIIHKFNLKWPECLETISILYLAQKILSHPNVTSKLCVQALSLCKLAIQNYMAPNLALLMQPDSRANEMGPVLYARMHDLNWEVRDSVLEVINTIATISEDKYPAFQDLLLENGFPQVIVDVAATDEESKVRATALTCTATFVRIDKIWDEKLCHLDLPKMAINSMTKEMESIVRKEAVRLVQELYVHRKWPKPVVKEMVKAMYDATVSDLHWEVKVFALEFWDQFIESQFNDQGMLDGIFPTVTFSKEHRKIVSLNKNEIRKRILKALDELAKLNCLGMLLVTLEDDSNLQVCKASGVIIKKFQSVFTQYKVNEYLTEFSPLEGMNIRNVLSSPNKDDENLSYSETETLGSAAGQHPIQSDIIPSIVNANDINLLASMYEDKLKISSKSESKHSGKLEYILQVDKNQFVHSVLQYDVDAHIEEKNRSLKTYTNSSGSILDNILSALQDGLLTT